MVTTTVGLNLLTKVGEGLREDIHGWDEPDMQGTLRDEETLRHKLVVGICWEESLEAPSRPLLGNWYASQTVEWRVE